MKPRTVIIVIPSILAMLFLLAFVATRFIALFEFAFYLVFGWLFYLTRVSTDVRVSWTGVQTAAVCLALLAVGLHSFLSWFRRVSGSDTLWHRRWTLSLLALIVLLFTAGIAAVGVTHQTGRLINRPDLLLESTFNKTFQRIDSTNNLKQMGFAATEYSENSHSLPAGATFNSAGRGLTSWQTAILPYMEEERLYNKIDHSLPWDHPANAAAYATQVKSFQFPYVVSTSADGYALSHYAGNIHLFGTATPMSWAEVEKMGTTTTVLFGECAGEFKPWGAPGNWRDPAQGFGVSPRCFGNPMQQPTRFVFADGHVEGFANADPDFRQFINAPNKPR